MKSMLQGGFMKHFALLAAALVLGLSISAQADAARVYATWSPTDAHPDIVLSSDLLTATRSTISQETWDWRGVRATIPVTSGTWYWETTVNFAGNGADALTGVTFGLNPLNISPGTYEGLVGPDRAGSCTWNGIVEATTGAIASGTVIRHLVDFGQASYRVSINGGAWVGISESAEYGPLPHRLLAIGSLYRLTDTTVSVTANFGASPFAYSVPAGANPGIYSDEPIETDGFERTPRRR